MGMKIIDLWVVEVEVYFGCLCLRIWGISYDINIRVKILKI